MPSSVIESMEYEPRRRSLLIAFRGGRGVYRYFDVPEREWKAFTASASKGTYLNREFKPRQHPFEKVARAARRSVGRFSWPEAKTEPSPGQSRGSGENTEILRYAQDDGAKPAL